MTTVGDLSLPTIDPAVALDRSFDIGIGTISLSTMLALSLVVAGASRSALLPFHRWLPSTLAAPTPVSAMLHAGVVNGAGVLFIRFAPVFTSSALAMSIAFVLGLATAVWATAAMLVRSDVKGALVCSTAGQMGFMTMQLAVGAFAAALFHIVGHAMYKAALFLGAGGSIAAAAERRHLPTRRPAINSPLRLTIAGCVPAVAMVAAFALIDPHLTPAGAILVAVFGWATAATAVNGWLTAPPWAGVKSLFVGAGAGIAAVFGYVGGLTVFETFVAPSLPFEVPAAVGPAWLGVALATVAAAALALRHTSGPAADRLRHKVYVGLLGFGYSSQRSASATVRPGEQRMRQPAAGAMRVASAINKGAKA